MTSGVAYILYGLFALGGVGLYLALPRPEGAHSRAGAVIGVAAIVGLLVLLGADYVAPHSANVFFYLFSAVALLAAGRVVTHPKPVYSAVYFALLVLCVAVLLVIQRAEFLAVALVIIYAGAILVTYAFVIMLAQQAGGETADLKSREPLAAVLVSFVVMGALVGRIDDLRTLPVAPARSDVVLQGTADVSLVAVGEEPPVGNTIAVGRLMFGSFVVVIELAGLLLLVAMIGAIAMARKRVPLEEVGPPPPPLGQIGRQVPPF